MLRTITTSFLRVPRLFIRDIGGLPFLSSDYRPEHTDRLVRYIEVRREDLLHANGSRGKNADAQQRESLQHFLAELQRMLSCSVSLPFAHRSSVFDAASSVLLEILDSRRQDSPVTPELLLRLLYSFSTADVPQRVAVTAASLPHFSLTWVAAAPLHELAMLATVMCSGLAGGSISSTSSRGILYAVAARANKAAAEILVDERLRNFLPSSASLLALSKTDNSTGVLTSPRAQSLGPGGGAAAAAAAAPVSAWEAIRLTALRPASAPTGKSESRDTAAARLSLAQQMQQEREGKGHAQASSTVAPVVDGARVVSLRRRSIALIAAALSATRLPARSMAPGDFFMNASLVALPLAASGDGAGAASGSSSSDATGLEGELRLANASHCIPAAAHLPATKMDGTASAMPSTLSDRMGAAALFKATGLISRLCRLAAIYEVSVHQKTFLRSSVPISSSSELYGKKGDAGRTVDADFLEKLEGAFAGIVGDMEELVTSSNFVLAKDTRDRMQTLLSACIYNLSLLKFSAQEAEKLLFDEVGKEGASRSSQSSLIPVSLIPASASLHLLRRSVLLCVSLSLKTAIYRSDEEESFSSLEALVSAQGIDETSPSLDDESAFHGRAAIQTTASHLIERLCCVATEARGSENRMLLDSMEAPCVSRLWKAFLGSTFSEAAPPTETLVAQVDNVAAADADVSKKSPFLHILPTSVVLYLREAFVRQQLVQLGSIAPVYTPAIAARADSSPFPPSNHLKQRFLTHSQVNRVSDAQKDVASRIARLCSLQSLRPPHLEYPSPTSGLLVDIALLHTPEELKAINSSLMHQTKAAFKEKEGTHTYTTAAVQGTAIKGIAIEVDGPYHFVGGSFAERGSSWMMAAVSPSPTKSSTSNRMHSKELSAAAAAAAALSPPLSSLQYLDVDMITSPGESSTSPSREIEKILAPRAVVGDDSTSPSSDSASRHPSAALSSRTRRHPLYPALHLSTIPTLYHKWLLERDGWRVITISWDEYAANIMGKSHATATEYLWKRLVDSCLFQ